VTLGAEVILADEVLAVGDSAFRQACEERVRSAGESGESVLFVSHDMSAIRRVCTRVIWIDRGRIVQDGSTETVVHAYVTELLAGHLLPPISTEGLAASCVLLDLRLLDADRAQVGALQATEVGYVDCLLRISRPDVSVSVEIELYQGKHQVLSATSPRPITSRQSMTFRAGIRIPADLLNERSYEARLRLRVASMTDPDLEAVVAADETLSFSVMNPHPDRSVWNDWDFGRPGLVSPRLTWTAERQAAQ
jgi:lipopolysaccharide transport system ATP-binding protein